MPYTLQGKVVLVTGGGEGIGKATAVALAQAGAQVIIADMNSDTGVATAQQIHAEAGAAMFIQTDIADPQQVARLFEQIHQSYNCLDAAVNNAGQFPGFCPLTECPQAAWDRMLLVNVTATWWCMQHEIRQMLQQGAGSIVNVASVAGLIGFPEVTPYTASKHAVTGLTKSAALEYAARGIRINAVCPGVINTPMGNDLINAKPGFDVLVKQLHPIGRLGEPEEIANLIVFLCSEQASFITGSIITADGGFTAQ